MITQSHLREILDYEPATGIFTWKVAKGNRSIGSEAGTLNGEGYTHIRIDGTVHRAHRLAWLYVHGEWPSGARIN